MQIVRLMAHKMILSLLALGLFTFVLWMGCSNPSQNTNSTPTVTTIATTAPASVTSNLPTAGSVTNQTVTPSSSIAYAQSYDDLVYYPEWQKNHTITGERAEYIKQEDPHSPTKTTVKMPGKEVTVTVTQVDSANWPIVKLYVSLTDRTGKPLQLVNPNLLTVVENNYVMPKDDGIFKVETNADAPIAKKIPINIALAVDKSGSMAWDANQRVLPEDQQPLAFAKKACINFLDRLGVMDRAVVFAFDHQILELGVNRSAVDRIQDLKSSGDTALYAVIFQSAVSIREKEGAKVLIVMTDGKNDVANVANNNVKIPLDQALQVVKDASIPVFPIAFGAGADRAVLKNIAEQSNGTYYETPNKGEIESLYQVIQSIINNQYIITYRSLSRDAVLDFVIIDGSEQHRGKEMLIPEDVKRQLEQLDDKDKRLKEKESELTKLGEDLTTREQVVKQKEEEQKQKDVELTKREEEVGKKELELKSLQKTLDDLEKQINDAKSKVEDRKKQLENEQKGLEDQQRQLEEREKQYDREKKALTQKEQEINQREKDLDTKEQNLEKRQKDLDSRQTDLEKQRKNLDSLERQLNAQDTDLKKLRTELDNRLTELQKQQRELEARTNRVNQQEKDNTKRQGDLDKRDRDLTQLRTQLDKENTRLTQLEKDLNKQLADVKNQQQIVQRAQTEIEQKNKEIQKKSDELQQMKQKYDSLVERFLKVMRDLGGNVDEIEKELSKNK